MDRLLRQGNCTFNNCTFSVSVTMSESSSDYVNGQMNGQQFGPSAESSSNDGRTSADQTDQPLVIDLEPSTSGLNGAAPFTPSRSRQEENQRQQLPYFVPKPVRRPNVDHQAIRRASQEAAVTYFKRAFKSNPAIGLSGRRRIDERTLRRDCRRCGFHLYSVWDEAHICARRFCQCQTCLRVREEELLFRVRQGDWYVVDDGEHELTRKYPGQFVIDQKGRIMTEFMAEVRLMAAEMNYSNASSPTQAQFDSLKELTGVVVVYVRSGRRRYAHLNGLTGLIEMLKPSVRRNIIAFYNQYVGKDDVWKEVHQLLRMGAVDVQIYGQATTQGAIEQIDAVQCKMPEGSMIVFDKPSVLLARSRSLDANFTFLDFNNLEARIGQGREQLRSDRMIFDYAARSFKPWRPNVEPRPILTHLHTPTGVLAIHAFRLVFGTAPVRGRFAYCNVQLVTDFMKRICRGDRKVRVQNNTGEFGLMPLYDRILEICEQELYSIVDGQLRYVEFYKAYLTSICAFAVGTDFDREICIGNAAREHAENRMSHYDMNMGLGAHKFFAFEAIRCHTNEIYIPAGTSVPAAHLRIHEQLKPIDMNKEYVPHPIEYWTGADNVHAAQPPAPVHWANIKKLIEVKFGLK